MPGFDKCIGCLTVEIKANFIARPPPVVAHARAQRAGRSPLFSEGEVRDGPGRFGHGGHLR
jgi:acyl-coenzyme A thioesterase PaaI-like protein